MKILNFLTVAFGKAMVKVLRLLIISPHMRYGVVPILSMTISTSQPFLEVQLMEILFGQQVNSCIGQITILITICVDCSHFEITWHKQDLL